MLILLIVVSTNILRLPMKVGTSSVAFIKIISNFRFGFFVMLSAAKASVF
jgi:hypothetical protein